MGGGGYTVSLAANFLFCFVSPSFLQVTRTTIKSLMRSSFGKIQPWTVELAALERLKKIFFYLRTVLMTCWLSGERSLPFGLLVTIYGRGGHLGHVTRVLNELPFPIPKEAPHINWLRLAKQFRRISIVDDDGQTPEHGHTQLS